jgi:thioredoxin 1
MTLTQRYDRNEPARAELDAWPGATLVEFGTDWCGWCRQAQPLIAAALAQHPSLRHLKVEDGPGRPLGRSFGVKLWPTLIFMNRGREIARVVRPRDAQSISQALAAQAAQDAA